MNFNRLYIVDISKPITGSVENTMSCKEELGMPIYVDYCDEPTTLAEYKIKENNPNLVAMTWEELEPHINKFRDSLCGKWTEITEERYYFLLEDLPPQRWRDIKDINKTINVFAMMEGSHLDLHEHLIKDKDKYFIALMPFWSSDATILKSYNEFLLTNKLN